MKRRGSLAVAGFVTMFALTLAAGNVFAVSNNECPVGLVSGLGLDAEFGQGTADLTRCIEKRNNFKLVVQISQLYLNGAKGLDLTRPYALANLQNMIKDYEITHGLQRGDYEIAAVFIGQGANMALNKNAIVPHKNLTNPNIMDSAFQAQAQAQVENLMKQGVKFYLCQNTARTMGIKADQVIPGIEFVTAGYTAMVDFEIRGYTAVHP